MLRKMSPLLLALGLVLGACGMNDGAVPNNDETPMDTNNDRNEENWTPNVEDDRTGGTNVDGLDNEQNGTGNGVNDGVINNDNMDNNDMMQNDETPNNNITGNDSEGKDDNLNNR